MLSWTKRITSIVGITLCIAPLYVTMALAGKAGQTPSQILTEQKSEKFSQKEENRKKRKQYADGKAKAKRCKENPDAGDCTTAAPAACDCWPSAAGSCGMREWVGRECEVYRSGVLGDRFLSDAKNDGALLYFDARGLSATEALEPAEQKFSACNPNWTHKEVSALPSKDYYYSVDLKQSERREACTLLNKRSAELQQDNPGCLRAVRTCLTVRSDTNEDYYDGQLKDLDEEDRLVDEDLKKINDQLVIYTNCPTCNRTGPNFGETLVGALTALAPVATSAIGLMGYSKYANTQSQMYGQYINNAYLAYQDQAQEYTQLGLPIGSFQASAPGISPYSSGYGYGVGGILGGGLNNGYGGGIGGNLGIGLGLGNGGGLNGGLGINLGLGMGGINNGMYPGGLNGGLYNGGLAGGFTNGGINGGAGLGYNPYGAIGQYAGGAYPGAGYGANGQFSGGIYPGAGYGANGQFPGGFNAGAGYGMNGQIPGYINGNVTTGIGPISGAYGYNPYTAINGGNPQYGYGAAGGGYYNPAYNAALMQQQQSRDYGIYQQQVADYQALQYRGQQILGGQYGGTGYGSYGSYGSPYAGAYGNTAGAGASISGGLYFNGSLGNGYLGLGTGANTGTPLGGGYYNSGTGGAF